MAAIGLASIGVIVAVGAVASADDTNATVVSVIDGDTVVVAHDDGAGEVVRLLNVDTPEHDECGWAEATDYLRDRLTGQRVELQLDTDTHDRYNRLLAGVFLGEELVNASIAGEGLGRPMLIQPNDRFYPQVTAAWTGPAAALEGTGCAKGSSSELRDSDDLYDLTADTDVDWETRHAAKRAWRDYEEIREADLKAHVGALVPPSRYELRTVTDYIDDPYDASAKKFTHEDELKAQLKSVESSGEEFSEEARATAKALNTPSSAPDADYEDERWAHVPGDTREYMLGRIDELIEESASAVAAARDELSTYRQLAAEARARDAAKARAAAAARAAARKPSASSKPSSGSNSSAPPGYYPRFGGPAGYNGPRCFAPGGQYWRPC